MAIMFTLNGKTITAEKHHEDMPLLWYLREISGLKGTKFGCGIGQCGACTVHINDKAVRSCVLTVAQLDGMDIKTIESLANRDGGLHPVQEAWQEVDVPQCGYCQAGQIMAATAMLKATPKPTDEQISEQMTNICRCGTYTRIRKAIHIAADKLAKEVT